MKFKIIKYKKSNNIIPYFIQIWNKQNKLLKEIQLSDIFLYIILIPFFHPRGFDECFTRYKFFFTMWLYVSLLSVLGLFIYMYLQKKLTYKKCIYYMLTYYGLFILITFITQGGITVGLQKLFAAPVLCILCMMYLRNDKDSFLRVSSNILIVLFILNLTVFNPNIMRRYIEDEHIIFLGHVQIVAPLGVLGVFLGFLIYIRNSKYKVKAVVLNILSFLVMISSGTLASTFSVIFLLSLIIQLLLKKSYKVFILDARIYFGIYIILNFLLILYTSKVYAIIRNYGLDLSFSGRTFVWKDTIRLIKEHFFIGYGAYGILIKTFWSNGMNYAHNEFFQKLLDGGIVLCMAFYVMLYSYISETRKVKNKYLLSFSNMCFFLMLIIMLFESVTEYYYFFVFISLLAYLPELINQDSVVNL